MPVQTPKCLVGIKATNLKEKGEALLKQEIALTLLLDYLFGKSSVHYESLYNEGLIDDSFSYDYTEENNLVLQWLAAIRSNLMSWKSV